MESSSSPDLRPRFEEHHPNAEELFLPRARGRPIAVHTHQRAVEGGKRVAPCERPRSYAIEGLILTSEENIANFALYALFTARVRPLPARLSIGIFLIAVIIAEMDSRVEILEARLSRFSSQTVCVRVLYDVLLAQTDHQEEYFELYACVENSNRGNADSFQSAKSRYHYHKSHQILGMSASPVS